jgi:hypothetical protein
MFRGNKSDDYTKLYATFAPVMWVKITINLSTTAVQVHMQNTKARFTSIHNRRARSAVNVQNDRLLKP